MISVSRITICRTEETLDEMSRSCHLKMLITSIEGHMNFRETGRNHDTEDQLKNITWGHFAPLVDGQRMMVRRYGRINYQALAGME